MDEIELQHLPSSAELDDAQRTPHSSISLGDSDSHSRRDGSDGAPVNPASENVHDALVHAHVTRLPPKDLQREVRAGRDLRWLTEIPVEHIFEDAKFLRPEDLVGAVVDAMIEREDLESKFSEEVQDALLARTHPAATFAHLVYSEANHAGEQPNFLVAYGSHPSLSKRLVSVVRFHNATNLGLGTHYVHLVVLILAPMKTKGTKTGLETARTFATLISSEDFRFELLNQADTDEDMRNVIVKWVDQVVSGEVQLNTPLIERSEAAEALKKELTHSRRPLGGLIDDVKRRAVWYFSDYKDGVIGNKAFRKTISTAAFLYFACILPSIAFGVLNDSNTDGAMNTEKVIYSQMFGGLVFALFGGQPLIVMLSTAPLALYIKVIYSISDANDFNFFSMYAWVGLWNAFFLIVYACTEASVLMRFSTRSVEETFAFFICIAFGYDAIRPLVEYFLDFYACDDTSPECDKASALLFLLLFLSTTLIGLWLYDFRRTPFLASFVREVISDYSLALSVLINSLLGSLAFQAVDIEEPPEPVIEPWQFTDMLDLPVWAIFAAAGFGFLLSLLFFMDQNISSQMVNTPDNRLRKGSAYHWDMLVVAVINALLSLFGMPWVHAALPHSPLHVRALADREKFYSNGHLVERVVHARETRLPAIISHAVIGVSVLAIPTPLNLIPTPVLYGVFLWMSITSLEGSQFWERLLLIFTEQRQYPPAHFVRRVRQRRMHLFTLYQIVGVLVLCAFGFVPVDYLQMLLPLAIILLLPARYLVAPLIFSKEELSALDGHE